MKKWFFGLKPVQYVVAGAFLAREISLSDYEKAKDVPGEERTLMLQRAALESSWWLALQRGEEIPPMAVKWKNGEISHAEMVAEVERVSGKRFS